MIARRFPAKNMRHLVQSRNLTRATGSTLAKRAPTEALMRPIATLVIFLALTGSTVAQVVSTIGPAHPVLKREATVAGELVRIGDLIENAGVVASTPIFRAPDLGETGTVEAFKVVDAVRAHGLVGIDTQGVSAVVVIRPGRIIGPKGLEAAIGRVLSGRYGLGDVKNLTFTFDREARPIHLESSASGDLQPTRIAYERSSGRFDLTFDVPGNVLMHATTLRYTGSVVETRNVAVLVRQVGRGEVIKNADVAIERRPKGELGDDVPDVASDVIGLAARRTLH